MGLVTNLFRVTSAKALVTFWKDLLGRGLAFGKPSEKRAVQACHPVDGAMQIHRAQFESEGIF